MKLKKVAALALTAAMLICALFLLPDTAQASAKVSGDFHYKVLSEKKKTAAITYVEKTGSKLVIPAKIKGYKVVQIGNDERKFYMGDKLFKDDFKEYLNNKCDCDVNTTDIDGSGHNCKNRILSGENAKKVKKVVLPDTVTVIGINAFVECRELKQINMPKKLKYIQAMAFAKTSIPSFVLPKTVKGIGYRAFADCLSLKKLTVKSDTVKIGEYAFESEYDSGKKAWTGKLKTIKLPSPFKGSLMKGCFYGYIGTSFTWPEFKNERANVNFFDGGFQSKMNLKTIKIAKKAEKIFIGDRTLPYAGKIKKLVIPAGVQKVTLEQQYFTLESLTIKGKNTTLTGEEGMGSYPYKEKRNYISVRKIIAPKNSKAWKYAKKAYYPNTFDFTPPEWMSDEDQFYTEKDIAMKKVKRKALS